MPTLIQPLRKSDNGPASVFFVLQAAIDGRGVALTRRSIAEADLASGSLIRLFDVALQSDWSHFLVWPKHSPPSKVLEALRAWLHEERGRST